MPLYVADYLADTQSLTTEQHGAYLLMLMHYWRSGEAIPDDMVTLRMVTKLSTHKLKKFMPTLEKIFSRKDGKFFHSRLEEELKKSSEISALRAKAGARGGKAKAKQMPPKSQVTSSSVPNGTGASAPEDMKKRFWSRGREVLVRQGVEYRQAGSLLGRLLKLHGEDPTVPLDVIDQIERDNIADPASWLGAMFKPENTARLPRDDAALPGWAASRGLPGARPGEDWRAYRSRLEQAIQQVLGA